jgi:hypothetical protein
MPYLAIERFIASIEELADFAPVRAALLVSGVYKLIARIAEATAEKAQFLGYLEDAAAELRDDIDNGDR